METAELFNQTTIAITDSASCGTNSTCCDLNVSANVFIAVYSLVFVVGLILNGFTLKVYFWGPVKTSLTVYLKNLAAADFLICLCLPLRVAHFASSSPLLLRVYCHIGANAFYLNMYASILFMGYVAANRYLKIVHPLGTHFLQTVRAARLVSTVTWTFLLTLTSSYVVVSLVTQRDVAAWEPNLRCEELHGRQLKMFYQAAHCCLAGVFALVLGSLLFFYCQTTRRLAQAQRRQSASTRSGRLARGRRNMLVLVGVFCVCFVPYHLVRLPYAFWWSQSRPPCQFFYLKELTTMLSALNVCLDPLIYYLFCRSFSTQLGRQGAERSRRQWEPTSTQTNNHEVPSGHRRRELKSTLQQSGNQTLQ